MKKGYGKGYGAVRISRDAVAKRGGTWQKKKGYGARWQPPACNAFPIDSFRIRPAQGQGTAEPRAGKTLVCPEEIDAEHLLHSPQVHGKYLPGNLYGCMM